MPTVGELEAFVQAQVPADLTDRVFDRLKATGGDSEDPEAVAKALEELQHPETVAAPEPTAPTAASSAAPAAAPDVSQMLDLFVSKIEGTLAPVRAALDDLHSRLTALEQTAAPSPVDDPVVPTEAGPSSTSEAVSASPTAEAPDAA